LSTKKWRQNAFAEREMSGAFYKIWIVRRLTPDGRRKSVAGERVLLKNGSGKLSL
jgi:hypothetical protein